MRKVRKVRKVTPRIEYGAQVVCVAAVVYVKDFALKVVTDWMATMAGVTPLRLVTRVWDGDTCGLWETVPEPANRATEKEME